MSGSETGAAAEEPAPATPSRAARLSAFAFRRSAFCLSRSLVLISSSPDDRPPVDEDKLGVRSMTDMT